MKTIVPILLLLFAFNVVFAQQEINNAAFKNIKVPSTRAILPTSFPNLNTLRGTNTNWVSYATDYATFIGAAGPYISVNSQLLLFPDTSIIEGVYHDTAFYPSVHSAAVMYDPYTTPNPWLMAASYTVDSVGVQFAYLRNLPDSIVDTLALTVLKGTTTLTLTVMGGAVIDVFPAVKYDYQSNSVDPASYYSTQKIPLTQSDSSDHFIIRSYAVSGVPLLGPPSIIGAAVSFIPGYKHTLNDSLDEKNEFVLLSSEENGVGDTMTYLTGDLNSSYIIPTFIRYNTDANWNGEFFPTFAANYKNAPWGAENHLIYFHLVTPNLGIKDLLVNNSLDFYPNPTSDIANFSYSLNQDAKKVTFKITDVTGREILNQNIGEQSQGSHQTSFSTKNFASGVYLYSFSVDNTFYNGKFIVN